MTDNTEYKMRLEIEAVKNLMDELRAAAVDDDEELVADALEGQSDIIEAIEKALDEIDMVDVLIEGLSIKIAEFTERRTALKNRGSRLRALIEQAMLMTERQKLILPTATLSLTKRQPGVVIIDESAIPAQYFVTPVPVPRLDRAALKEALKEGSVIGAELDNGSVSLTVRRK